MAMKNDSLFSDKVTSQIAAIAISIIIICARDPG